MSISNEDRRAYVESEQYFEAPFHVSGYGIDKRCLFHKEGKAYTRHERFNYCIQLDNIKEYNRTGRMLITCDGCPYYSSWRRNEE